MRGAGYLLLVTTLPAVCRSLEFRRALLAPLVVEVFVSWGNLALTAEERGLLHTFRLGFEASK